MQFEAQLAQSIGSLRDDPIGLEQLLFTQEQAIHWPLLFEALTEFSLDYLWDKAARSLFLRWVLSEIGATEISHLPQINQDEQSSSHFGEYLSALILLQKVLNCPTDGNTTEQLFQFLELHQNIAVNEFVVRELIQEWCFSLATLFTSKLRFNIHILTKLQTEIIQSTLNNQELPRFIPLIVSEEWNVPLAEIQISDELSQNPHLAKDPYVQLLILIQLDMKHTSENRKINISQILQLIDIYLELKTQHNDPSLSSSDAELLLDTYKLIRRKTIDLRNALQEFIQHCGRLPSPNELPLLVLYIHSDSSPYQYDQKIAILTRELTDIIEYQGTKDPHKNTIITTTPQPVDEIQQLQKGNLKKVTDQALTQCRIVYKIDNPRSTNEAILLFLLEHEFQNSNYFGFVLALSHFRPIQSIFNRQYSSIATLVADVVDQIVRLHANLISSEHRFIAQLVEQRIITNIECLTYLQSRIIKKIFTYLSDYNFDPKACKAMRIMLATNPKSVKSFIEQYNPNEHTPLDHPQYIVYKGEKFDEFNLAARELTIFTPILYLLWLEKARESSQAREAFVSRFKQLRKKIIYSEKTGELIYQLIQQSDITISPAQISQISTEIIAVLMELDPSDAKMRYNEALIQEITTDHRAETNFPLQRIVHTGIRYQEYEATIEDLDQKKQLENSRDYITDQEQRKYQGHQEFNVISELLKELTGTIPNHIENNTRFYQKVENSYNWLDENGNLGIEAIDYVIANYSVDLSKHAIVFSTLAHWRNQVKQLFIKTPHKEVTHVPLEAIVSSSLLSFYAKFAADICTAGDPDLFAVSLHLDYYSSNNQSEVEFIGNNQLFVLNYLNKKGAVIGRVLLIRGLNQTENLASTPAAIQYVDNVLATTTLLAQQNKYDAVLLCPHNDFHPDSNRVNNVAYLSQLRTTMQKISFETELEVAGNNYQRCPIDHAYIVWQRKKHFFGKKKARLENAMKHDSHTKH